MKHYIFGYGSLINTRSRLRTANTSQAIPVRVHGLQRIWNFHNPSRRRNVLGATFSEDATCNGVIVEVNKESLAKFDEREGGYQRVELDWHNIKVLNGEPLSEGKIWVYIPEDPKLPTDDSPIQQSYIDVVLAGCLEIGEKLGIGEEFAVECIKTSLFWKPWANDRKNPGYPRTLRDLPTNEIDKILNKIIPEEFSKRIELE